MHGNHISSIGVLFHKSLPFLKVALVMYVAAVGALWGTVRLLSPVEQGFSLLRSLSAVVLMTILCNSERRYLGPMIGHWQVLLLLVTCIVVVKASFTLPIWRCAVAAGVYFGVVAAIYHFLTLKATH
ncbi:MAG: hypothetical protein JWQ04_1599 [Pedosphaera sp.]|nr:hypothetical protein [Pedosphaera sp.]